ncbi:hypothetical protein L873DRAFT_1829338 [Choiromyces venosus 120613-1]|uniref:Copper-fist domain-containing protein n=1 Tax=Choiromyces venosus 120613-1 TaxID=1336337 RepID=A0A3N4JJ09_9PEZI|nr:hypothetical protein L873DRAFT_1829338 [Choiromyces venosus 120613-1]
MACEACIRGHRVSGCNHSDRKLLPIAKKGRPVSQCNHCRQMRKARSAHVKCDCGERLALLKESKAAGKPVSATASACHSTTTTATTAAPSEEGDPKDPSLSCPCCHGGRCTCALKKEHLDSVPELAAPTTCASIAPTATATATVETRKPRLQATHSEGSLATLHTFANGHHRPTHKHHGSIHGSSPYTIPHVGHTGHTFGEHIGGCTKTPAATVSAPPSAASQKPRRIKSEHSSPDLRSYPALKMANTGITPLELTPQLPPQPVKPISSRVAPGLSVNTNAPYSMHEFRSQELLPSADSECSFQFSAGLYPPQSAGWPPAYSAFDNASFDEQPLDPGVDYSISQLDIGNYLRFQSSAGPNGSVSGDEIDDFIGPVNGPGGLGGARTVTRSSSSDTSDQAESDFRVSAASSFVGLQQASSALLPGNSFEDLENLNATMGGPIQPTDPSYGLIIGTVDGTLDSETRGLSLYGGYSDGFLSLKDMATTKATELGGIPSSLPPADDSDFLWMASPMGPNSQNGAPPPERWIS